MAGGYGAKMDPKAAKILKNAYSSEVLKDSQEMNPAPKTESPKFSLRGVLGLNQTIEINKSAANTEKKVEKVFFGINHLEQEQKILFDNRQKQLEKTLADLRSEIQALIRATDNLEKDVEIAALTPAVEYNEYEVSFFQRIKKFVANFRQNISEASLWLQQFNTKKKKKNYFWTMARDKKRGGDQYLFSEEHSVARSAT